MDKTIKITENQQLNTVIWFSYKDFTTHPTPLNERNFFRIRFWLTLLFLLQINSALGGSELADLSEQRGVVSFSDSLVGFSSQLSSTNLLSKRSLGTDDSINLAVNASPDKLPDMGISVLNDDSNWLVEVQQQLARREYFISSNNKGLQAPNRKLNLRTYFAIEGTELTELTNKSPVKLLAMKFSGLQRDVDRSFRKLEPVPAQHSNYQDNRFSLLHLNGVKEWLVNSELGLEHGFYIPQRPEGESLLKLNIALSVGSVTEQLSSEQIVGLRILLSNGRYLNYNKLVVVDAKQQQLDAWFVRVSSQHFQIQIEDKNATYPLVIDSLLSGNANTILAGDQSGSQFGWSVSGAGDVNGDGFDDVIVGAWEYDYGGVDGGAVFVFHGGFYGLTNIVGTLLGAEADGDRFGYSISDAGDVNGDGYDDVIVGAPYYSSALFTEEEGRSYIYYGSSNGLTITDVKMLEVDNDNDHFGWSVSGAGDVNGDGYDDVIVGVPKHDNGQVREGAAYIYHGSDAGIIDIAATLLESNQEKAYFGWSVSGAGDVNGDGYDDVIVGSLWYDNGESDEGMAFVYHGSITGISTSVRTQLEANQDYAEFGNSVSDAGDVNGDGYDDVIVGAHFYDNGENDEGVAFVYEGSSHGIDPTAMTLLERNQEAAQFGESVSGVGDVNGDSYGDLIVGAYLYTSGETEEGASFVYYGSIDGIETTVGSQQEANQNSAQFGLSVSGAGDVNGDGYDDVIVGANLYGQNYEGVAFVYYGLNNAPMASSVSITDNNGYSAVVGDTLTGDYTYEDVESDVEGISTFRWFANGGVISDAILSSYTLEPDDSGKIITFEVIPVAVTGTMTGNAVRSGGLTVNNIPVAVEDSHYSVNEGASLSGTSVLTNDSDVDGDNLTAIKVSDPNYGSLTLESDGSFTYVHDGSETTFDFFMYSANDEFSSSNTVTVSITIIPQNDAPVADEQSLFIDQDNNVSFTLSGSDADGDIIEYIVVTQPVNGVLSGILPNLTYTPNAFYVGSDMFTFKVNDGVLDSTIVTVNFTVNDVNHPPEAVDDQISLMPTGEGILIDVLANDSDMDGDKLTVISVSVIYGTVTIQPDGILNYTPLIDNTVTDIITYTINDSHGGTAHGVVTIEILANASPVLIDENSEMTQGGSVSLNLLDNDLDPEGGELTLISIDNDFVNFTADGDAKFTPDGSFFGTHTLYYTVQDNANNTAIGHWHIIVTETEAKREPEVKHESKGGASLYWGLFMLMVCFRRLSLTTRWCEYMKRNNCLRV